MSRDFLRHSSLLLRLTASQLLQQLLPAQVNELLQLDSKEFELSCDRERYINTYTFQGSGGYLDLKEDGIRVVFEGYTNSSTMPRLIFKAALRDRQLDATEIGSPLGQFSNTDPACNRLPYEGFLGADLSVYSWHPEHFLPELDRLGTIGHFIADPDHYFWRHCSPDILVLWQEAVRLNRAPWQQSQPIRGAAQTFLYNSIKLLKQLGYEQLDGVPSWYNVANFLERQGFQFTYGEHAAAYAAIMESLRPFAKLSLQQQSWLVALQNLPEAMVPERLRLAGRWPVTHTNQYWVRMHLNLDGLEDHALQPESPFVNPKPKYPRSPELSALMAQAEKIVFDLL